MVRKVIKWPSSSLRVPCTEVDFGPDWFFRDAVKGHSQDLQETLITIPNGLALADNQIAESGFRMFFHDGRAEFTLPQLVVNPKWKPIEEAGQNIAEEGCLSVPELWWPVLRWSKVDVEFHHKDGTPGHLTVEGLEARMVQHECDHLDGKLLVDVLPKDMQVKLKMQAIRNRKAGKR